MVGMPPQVPQGVLGNTPVPGPTGMGAPSAGGGPPLGVPPGMMAQVSGNPGADPRNSMMGQPASPPDDDDEAGSIPAITDPGQAQVIRSMHRSYDNKGVNPHDNHTEMSKKWERAFKDRANRDALKAAKMQEMQMVQKAIQNLRRTAGKSSMGSPSPVPANAIRR